MRRVLPVFIVLGLLMAAAPRGLWAPREAPVVRGLVSVTPSASDTFRLTVRDSLLPNTAAADSGWILPDASYDVIVNDSAGEDLRFGSWSSALPDSAYDTNHFGLTATNSTEDDRACPAYGALVWFNVAAIPSNVKILDAKICFSMMKFTSTNVTTGYIAARADTNAADFACLDYPSRYAPNPNNMQMTFNNVDGHSAWSLPLASRDDFHDFGPRGSMNSPGVNAAANTALYVDVTDDLQQIVDAGTQGRGLLSVIYPVGISSTTLRIAAGQDINYAPTGNPQFTCTYATPRGQKPWGGVPMPVVVTLDDGDTSHVYFENTLLSAGVAGTEFFGGASMAGNSSRMSQAQFDALNDNPLVDIGMHGRNHDGLGNAASQDELDYWLYRDWTAATLTAPRDTTAGFYKDFAYPANGGMAGTYSLAAMSSLVAHGYRSARAAGQNGWTGFSRENYLPWDGYANIYLVGGLGDSSLFGADSGSKATNAHISDQFGDMVDSYYTDHLKSPIILYWHDTVAATTYPNGCDYDQFNYFISVVDSMQACQFMTYRRVMDLRTAGSPFISPASVTVANGATTQNETSAAICDSARTANSDDNFLKMWIGPK